jgi:protein-S-isoprenylcysteine O-methyltransferase Ste14
LNKNISLLIVAAQVTLIIYIGVSGNILPVNSAMFILELICIVTGVWAMTEMKFRFNIFPSLIKNSFLITSGPFSYVRNPMYSATIFITLIWIINDFSYLRLSAWILLIIVLNIKIIFEEEVLSKEFPDYNNYKNKTKKLIPFIY